MHFSPILLGLVGSASAIDLYLHSGRNCDGSAQVCTGLNPDVCCFGGSNDNPTLGFRGIPTNWNIEARGYRGGSSQCGGLPITQRSQGSNFVCLNAGSFWSGGGYGFVNKKRRGIEDAATCAAAPGTCPGGVRRPDTLILADGASFNLGAMSEDHRVQILEIATSGGNSTDIPKELGVYKK